MRSCSHCVRSSVSYAQPKILRNEVLPHMEVSVGQSRSAMSGRYRYIEARCIDKRTGDHTKRPGCPVQTLPDQNPI
jgi:hypothetical protein